MPEPVEQWWARRQWSKTSAVPYPVGTYRADWARYPILIRQFHPDLNCGIALSQVPPAADVYLLWVCESGHRIVATPVEQRNRPGRVRRRSSWCPDCAELAAPKRQRPAVIERALADGSATSRRSPNRTDWLTTPRDTAARRPTARRVPGDAFVSLHAPRTASAAEGDLRQRLGQKLSLDSGCNAIVVRQPFFDRLEVWPDIVLSELRVVIEYDTTGRHGLEHVGRREAIDRRKDRLLRAVGWEVVRIRCGALQPIGPFDIQAPGVSATLIDRIVERLGEIRGELIVDAYALP